MGSLEETGMASSTPMVAGERNTLRPAILGTGDAIAQSIALLTLVMGVAFSTSFAAAAAGAAVPLAYVVAGLGSLCLASVIIRFTRRLASAGGIYTYIAHGLGPQAGFVGGWMYAGSFAIGITFVLAIASSFLSSLLANLHISLHWFVLFCFLLVILFLFAFLSIQVSTRTQLILAVIGGVSVLALAAIILAHGGAEGITLTPLSPTALPHGVSSLFFASVFTFTSFIGFEGAAVLGEETANPHRTIPRAILAAILIGVVFYLIVSYAMSIGYGTTHASTWASDQAPLDTLANRYAGPWLATLIDLMVAVNAFIAALAGVHLTARMLYAMGRDGGIPMIFGWTHQRYKSPWVGIVSALGLTLILGATLGLALGPFELFGFLATTGSLGILFAYILIALSGIAFSLQAKVKGGRRSVEVFLPLIAVGLCSATIYSSVVPVPAAPLSYAPYITGAWLLLGLFVLMILWRSNPERVRQFGKLLADEAKTQL